MGRFGEAFRAGQDAWAQRDSESGFLKDPVGDEGERERLRGMGKWRFVLVRGILGWGVPFFLWLVLTNFSDDLKVARLFHESTLQRLLGSWMFGLCFSCILGIIVGLLAWRRLVSDVWPNTKPDPESSITMLGPLRRL